MYSKKCIQCGYCCTVRACSYGIWDEAKKQCKFLTDESLCEKYNEIKEITKKHIYKFFNTGCSSSLLNTRREEMKIKMEVKEFYHLRELNSFQIALGLREKGCDPDVAVIAAWWVMHNENPKNWAQYMSLAQTKMCNMRISKKPIPKISDHLFKIIMKNYKANKISVHQSLLPRN